jgi:hypothetical protein
MNVYNFSAIDNKQKKSLSPNIKESDLNCKYRNRMRIYPAI